MAGVVEGFRWALLGGVRPEHRDLADSRPSAALVVARRRGLVYFRRMERVFADMV